MKEEIIEGLHDVIAELEEKREILTICVKEYKKLGEKKEIVKKELIEIIEGIHKLYCGDEVLWVRKTVENFVIDIIDSVYSREK